MITHPKTGIAYNPGTGRFSMPKNLRKFRLKMVDGKIEVVYSGPNYFKDGYRYVDFATEVHAVDEALFWFIEMLSGDSFWSA
jgi:hypothetical protein